MIQTDYSERGNLRHFMAKKNRDDLETAYINSTIDLEADKIRKQYSSDPVLFREVVLKLAQKVLQE